MRATDACVNEIKLLGEGGNFDPGVEYAWSERDESLEIAWWPHLSAEATFDFLYRPQLFLSPATDAPSGACRIFRGSGGKLTLEARSGTLLAECVFESPRMDLPDLFRIKALHWRVVNLPAAVPSTVPIRPTCVVGNRSLVDEGEDDLYPLEALPPMFAHLRCVPFLNPRGEPNRIRLVLDRIDYWAPPAFPVGAIGHPGLW